MSLGDDRVHRSARRSRWVASGLTAAVTVGAVGAMADTAPDPSADDGAQLGAVARHQGETAAAAMMAAADAGAAPAASPPTPPPTVARADVS